MGVFRTIFHAYIMSQTLVIIIRKCQGIRSTILFALIKIINVFGICGFAIKRKIKNKYQRGH